MKRQFPLLRRALCLLLALCALPLTSLGEYGRVATPKGPVKVRKSASAKSKLVCEIPNNTILEIDEVGDEWCHVVYGGKDGYVMTKFLSIPSMGTQGVAIRLSADELTLGETLEVTVGEAEADEAAGYTYHLLTGAKKRAKAEAVPYSTVYARPEEEGLYSVEVTARAADGSETTGEAFFRVTAGKEEPEEIGRADGLTVYSQRDGWWIDKRYGESDLSTSGCAIFTLSHALQLLGYQGEEILPETLAKRYAFCLVDGGTLNETLIGRSGKNFGFATRSELIEDKARILQEFAEGAVFTFSIVKSHIALAAGVSEDGAMVRIVDSAPSVTLERIKNEQIWIEDTEKGGFRPVTDLSEVPGARYYFDTASFGGLVYYLPMDYVAKRGVRLIKPKGR